MCLSGVVVANKEQKAEFTARFPRIGYFRIVELPKNSGLRGHFVRGGDMIRMTVTLIVAIYVVLIVVPPADHGREIVGREIAAPRDAGGNWLVAMISGAEAGVSRPPETRAASALSLQSSPIDGLIETADGFALDTADGDRLVIAAVINPVDLLPQNLATQTTVASVTVATPVATDVAPAPPDTPAQIWRVAASAVNFREGPSTDARVLASLTWGEEVEFLAEAPDDWAHLRIVGSGIEGYMAARFLERVN